MNLWKAGTILIAALLLVGASVFVYLNYIRETPEQAVKSFYVSLCDGQKEKAQSQLSASVPFGGELLQMGLSGFVKECKENGGFSAISFGDTITKFETARVPGTVKYQNGSLSKFDMKLYLEGGQWKIAFQDNTTKESK